MKNFFQVLVFILMTGNITSTLAQEKLDASIVADLQKTPKYAFGVTDDFHFKGVLGLYDTLVENGVEIEAFEIVVKGKIVSELVKGSDLESYFQKYQGKVRVSVCSMAMKKWNVIADQLFEGLIPVPTASIRMLQLQAKGYNTLSY
ncbi:DsrE family protein [Flagellimonas sediminis]|uniref:Uncharacterized protein n=1 Tax=Flagellimonas sediminis TaxID=2696468 RepID=A0A6I5L011_9FLAO|nr:DsrE family protein [Allomuricauda sediminis]NDV43518.1 hypothetical protein [Allomuricauda sediminis]